MTPERIQQFRDTPVHSITKKMWMEVLSALEESVQAERERCADICRQQFEIINESAEWSTLKIEGEMS